MQFFFEFISTHEQWLKFISIPLISALIGWSTNYMAVRMIFEPLRFHGFGRLGWQGIIPRHAVKLSKSITHILTSRLIQPHEIYERVDPAQINLQIRDLVEDTASEIVRDVIESQNPGLWKLLPEFARKSIENDFRTEIPEQINKVYHSFGEEIDEVLQFDDIVHASLSGDNTRHLIEMFQRCGGPEFRFIVRSGLYFGVALGLVQLVLTGLFDNWAIMPAMGLLVGYSTNWLALYMIFRPLQPRSFGGFRYQGLFLKRQPEVAREFASVVANRIFTTENLMRMIFEGRGGDAIVRLVMQKARESTESKLRERALLVQMAFGSDKIEAIKAGVTETIVARIPSVADRIQGYLSDTLQIESTVAERLAALSAAEFEELLHSVFREDETTLIVLGAGLGAVVGLLQAAVLYLL